MIIDESASIASIKALAKKPFIVAPKPDTFEGLGKTLTASAAIAVPGSAIKVLDEAIPGEAFKGVGTAAALSVPSAAVEAIRAGATVVEEATGVDYAKRDKDLPPTISQYATSALNRMLPKPETTGAAGQIIFGLGKTIGKAIGYSTATGNPITGAMLTGADEGLNEYTNLRNEGIEKIPAAKAGLIHGAVTAGSLAAPVAGSTIAKTIGLAAATGPAAYIAENAAIREVLRRSNHDEIAKRYDPTDVTGLVISTIPGAVFGAAAHAMRNRSNVALIRNAATQQGVNPDLAQTISSIETGGTFSHEAQNPQSSAQGLFQVIDDTWIGQGGTHANRNNPAAQAEIGVKIIADNIVKMRQVLKREPMPHEVYMSHLFGFTGAKKVLLANPGANILDVVKTFDSKNAKAIVKNNKMQGMTVAQVIDKWKKFTDEHQVASITPEETAAIRVRTLENHAMSTALNPDDINSHLNYIESARAAIDNNEQLDVPQKAIRGDADIEAILASKEFNFDETPSGDLIDNVPTPIVKPTAEKASNIPKEIEGLYKLASETVDIHSYLSHPTQSKIPAFDYNALIALHELKDNPADINEMYSRYKNDRTALPEHIKIANAYDSLKTKPAQKIVESPEIELAKTIINDNPDISVGTGNFINGVEEKISASELFKQLDENILTSEKEGNAFIDAVTCFLGG